MGEKLEDYQKRLKQPRVKLDEAIAWSKARSAPLVTPASSPSEMSAAASEDYYTRDECRQNPQGPQDGKTWMTKNVYSVCNLWTDATIDSKQCDANHTNCRLVGQTSVRVTVLGYGHINSRYIDWHVWFDQWKILWGSEASNTLFNLSISCTTYESGTGCSNTPNLGETRTLADWKIENTLYMQRTDTSSNKSPDFKSHHSLQPIFLNVAEGTKGEFGSVVARCDNVSYITTSPNGGCSFPFVDRFLEYDYSKLETQDSVGFYWDAMFHLDEVKRYASGRFVPGGYWKQSDGAYHPLQRQHPVNRNSYKVQKECKTLYGDPYTEGPNGEDNYYQCDEFPFASTVQSAANNGEGSLETWAAKPVISSHNTKTGNALNAFYERDRVLSLDEFFVSIKNGPSGCHGCVTKPMLPLVVPTEPAADNKLGGSFIQPDLIDSWSSDDTLRAEFAQMKTLNMSTAILQWTANSHDNRAGGAKTAIYPTALPGYTRNTQTDVLGRALNVADEKGLNVWVGLQVNDDWWRVYANDQTWLDNEDATARALADDIWARYGGHQSFAGWYLAFELDNVNFSSTASQDRMIRFYQSVIGHVKQRSHKPVAIAPFYNAVNTALPGWQDATTWGQMWARVLDVTGIDVVALQDGIGAGHADAATLPTWFRAMKNAIDTTSSAAKLVADTETFRIGASGLQPMSTREIVAAVKAVDPFVQGYWSFSFNHYQSPRLKFAAPAYLHAYELWQGTTTGDGTDGTAPSTPTNLTAMVDSPQNVILSWNSSTDSGSGVAGYHIYRDGELVADKIDARSGFFDAQLDGGKTYRYEVRAFDGSGMESGLSNTVYATTPALPEAPVDYARCGAASGAPGCSYTLDGAAADPSYADTNGAELTDGRYGPELYGDEWQGRNAVGTYDFTVDLGETKSIREIGSRWFQVRQDYAFLPEKVEYFVSDTPNAADFVQVDSISTPAVSARIQAKYYRTINLDAHARYVKMRVHGGTAWTMTDELEVKGS